MAAQTLGRPLSGGAANVAVGLIRSGNDVRRPAEPGGFPRRPRCCGSIGTRTTVSLDFYNMMNVSTVLAQNNTFGPAWQRPSSILPARFAKVSLQFDF